MSLEANKELVRRFVQDVPHNPALCDEILAPTIHWHAIQHATVNADTTTTPESEKEIYAHLDKVWGTDRRMDIDEMIAEGDRVMLRWTFHGVQHGEYYGLPSTHRPVSYAGINIYRIAEGRIAEVWDMYDRLWLWQQLGALPPTLEIIARAKAEIESEKPVF